MINVKADRIADEIKNLKQEAAAFREARANIAGEEGPKRAFEKVSLWPWSIYGVKSNNQVFKDDINRLLAMEDLWNKEGRIKPTSLDFDSIMAGTFPTPPLRSAAAPAAPAADAASAPAQNGKEIVADSNNAKLRDQRELSLKENLELFIDRWVPDCFAAMSRS